MVLPVITASLVMRKFSGTQIGILASSVFLSIFVLSPFVSSTVQRWGSRRMYNLSRSLIWTAFLIFMVSENYFVWLAASYIIGVGAAFVWPMTEGAVVNLAPEGKKGSYSGLYQTGLGLAFAGGPFVSSTLYMNKNWIFMAASIISFGSWVFVRNFPWPNQTIVPNQPQQKVSWRLALVSGLLVSAFVGGLFENGLSGIAVAYGMHIGLESRHAMSLAGVIGLGSLLAPFGLGRLADKIGVMKILITSLMLLSLNMLALFFVKNLPPVIWLLAFLWGAAGAGLYTVSMTSVAIYFPGPLALGATTLMISLYTLGAFLGPFFGGVAFDLSKDYGIAALFLGFSLLAWIIQILGSKLNKSVFSI